MANLNNMRFSGGADEVCARGSGLSATGREVFVREAVAAFLPETRMDGVRVFDSVDSTNTVLKGLAADGAPGGTVVMADHQSGGRGRRGRSFVSPAGVGIYLSYLFRPESGFGQLAALTGWAAVAAADAIQKACGVEPRIKWVNDLLVHGKKISGILTEAIAGVGSSAVEACVIGIGVNVNDAPGDFPPELAEIATSLSMESGGKQFCRGRLAAEIIAALDGVQAKWPGDGYYLRRYRELGATAGSRIAAYPQMIENGGGRTGTALAVNDDFSLKVEFDDGSVENLGSGEVSVKGLCGFAGSGSTGDGNGFGG